MSLPANFSFYSDAVQGGFGHRLRGIHPSGRFGNQFVKRVPSPRHLVETGISRFLQAARVPHAPVSYSFRDGDHIVHAPWIDGKKLTMLTDEDMKHPKITKERGLHTLASEWLGGVADRHGGNYLLHPRQGIVPLDFELTGAKLVPPGDGWGDLAERPHEHIRSSALFHLLKRQGLIKPHDPIPEATVRHLRAAAPELDAHHAAAFAGYDEDHREPHREAFEKRLKFLHDTPHLTLAHLLDYEPKS